MKRNFIQLSQRDSRWASYQLGTSPTYNLGQAGCYVTSFCVIASYYGFDIFPPDLNNQFLAKGLFVNGGLISSDDDLAKLFPAIQYTTSYNFPNTPPTPANLGLLRDLLADPTKTVIVEIDLGNGNVHFTPVEDCDGTTVTIMNVYNGQVQDFRSVYGDPQVKILKYVVYTGVPHSDPLVCDRKSVRDIFITKASNLDTVANFFGDSEGVRSAPKYGDNLVLRLTGLIAAAVPGSQPTTPPAPTLGVDGPTTQQKNIFFQDLSSIWDNLFRSKGGGQ